MTDKEILHRIQGTLTLFLQRASYPIPSVFEETLSLDSLGMDSIDRVGLLNDLEGEFDITLDPNVAHECERLCDLVTIVRWGLA